MDNYYARHMIEALRSGVPSKDVGEYFSSSRVKLRDEIINDLDSVCNGDSKSRIILGKYGEGKTHMINSIYAWAQKRNMVVSLVSLGKESPMNNLAALLPKILSSTYLPQSVHPGFLSQVKQSLTATCDKTQKILLYATRELESDRLYFVFRAFMECNDEDSRIQLENDLMGGFLSADVLRQLYQRIVKEKYKPQSKFSKSRNAIDYYRFMANLFSVMGYSGWVILFDEAELIGRYARISRFKAYENISKFLDNHSFPSLYSFFAFSSSYSEDVISSKDDYGYIEQIDDAEKKATLTKVLNSIVNARELASLSQEELNQAIFKIVDLHEKAYQWKCTIPAEVIYSHVKGVGLLLRTKIRATIEYLDQVLQYGDADSIKVGNLSSDSFQEEGCDIDNLLESDE